MVVVFARTGGKISTYSSRSHPRDCANPLGARCRNFVLVSQSLDDPLRVSQFRDTSPLARISCHSPTTIREVKVGLYLDPGLNLLRYWWNLICRTCCVKSILMRLNGDENNLAIVFMFRGNAKRIRTRRAYEYYARENASGSCLLCSRESRVIPRCTR
ncbi:uncharacterized protein LOC115243671 [Formica exsecta]|uniref:uncharacterized protein LOC115243671 n=1 Tax=Formica exsecta TaxID=72781 RepID=UPI001144CE78|nr:uncharacterized protein LOC115243671 [Formica exsecta]